MHPAQPYLAQFAINHENDRFIEALISRHESREAFEAQLTEDRLKKDFEHYSNKTTFSLPTLQAKARVIRWKNDILIKRYERKLKNLKPISTEIDELSERDLISEITAMRIGVEYIVRSENLQKMLNAAKQRIVEDSRNKIYAEDFDLLDMDKQQIRKHAISMADDYLKSDDPYAPNPVGARVYRKRQRLAAAAIELNLKVVGKYAAKRCTLRAVRDRKEMNLSTDDFINKSIITNQTSGNSIPLAEVAFTKRKRLSEIYCIAKGLEKLAIAQSMKWASVVVTLEPEYHINPKSSGSWDGTLPDASKRILSKRWIKLRAYLAKHSVTLSGFWTLESHEDATPHINFMVFFNQESESITRQAFNTYFGHSEKAVKFRLGGDVEPGQKVASFASYCFKYFFKAFNDNDDKLALSEEAWASSFGMRRYGFFGIPSLTAWRRLRASILTPNDKETATLWRAARRGDAAEYIALNGGLGIKQKDRQFQSNSVQHLKSCVVIGVINTKNNTVFNSKTVGEWTIQTLRAKIKDSADNCNGKQNQKDILVTVKPSYPSELPSAPPNPDFNFGYSLDFQRHRHSSPPLIH